METKVTPDKPPVTTMKPLQQEVESGTTKAATTEVTMSMVTKTSARPSETDKDGFST
jgi:hypothetical protein